jgi:predicted transcriptional regulator
MEERGLKVGELQLEVLKTLWRIGAGTVAEIHQGLEGGARLAHNTVATLLRRLEARGLVRHRQEGRKFIYEPAVTERRVMGNVADDVLDRVFEGRLADMVSHLLTTREVSKRELDELERLIAARKKTK